MKRSCDNCRWEILLDYGYSNYTVEGTLFSCAIQLHPSGSFDHWYGEDTRLDHGSDCEGYDYGKPVHLDVEKEHITTMTNEQRQSLNMLSLWEP